MRLTEQLLEVPRTDDVVCGVECAWSMVTTRGWEVGAVCVVLANTLLVLAEVVLYRELSSPVLQTMHMVGDVLLGTMVIEVAVLVAAWHPFRGPKAFFRQPTKVIDAVIVAIAVLARASLPAHGVQILRIFGFLSYFAKWRVTAAVSLLQETLRRSASRMVGNIFFLIFFWILFAVTGLQCFGRSLSRRCVVDISSYPSHEDGLGRVVPQQGGVCTPPLSHIILAVTLAEDVSTREGIEGVVSQMGLTHNWTGTAQRCWRTTCLPPGPPGLPPPMRLELGIAVSEPMWTPLDTLIRKTPRVVAIGGRDIEVLNAPYPLGDTARSPPPPSYVESSPRTPCKHDSQCSVSGSPHFVVGVWTEERGSDNTSLSSLRTKCLEGDNPQEGLVSFDTLPEAMLTVFQVATLCDWGMLVFWLQRAESELLVSLWAVSVIIIMTYIVINLNIAIVIAVFSEQRAESDVLDELVCSSRRPSSVALAEFPQHPYATRSAMRRAVRGIVMSVPFEVVTNLLVVAFIATQASKHTGQSAVYDTIQLCGEWAFLGLIAVEVFLRLAASDGDGLGGMARDFFRHPWNRFDLVMLVISLVSLLPGGGMWPTALRSLRFLRAGRLFDHFAHLRHICNSIINGLAPICNVLFFLFFTILAFSLVGSQLFRGVLPDPPDPCPLRSVAPWALPPTTPWNVSWEVDGVCTETCHAACGASCTSWGPPCSGPRINTTTVNTGSTASGSHSYALRLNFNDWSTAMLSLFVITSGDSWVYPMYGAIASMGKYAVFPAAFFISYFVFTNWILLNLFTAVILENFALTDSIIDELYGDTVMLTEEQLMLGMSRPALDTPRCSEEGSENDAGRSRLARIVTSESFERIMVVVILFSCVVTMWEPQRLNLPPGCEGACLERHLEHQLSEEGGHTLLVLQYVVFAVFACEAAVKMAAFGLFGTPDSYFGGEDHSNKLDFVILVSLLLSFLFPQLKYIRLARAYRPLRLVNKVETVRVLTFALLRSLPPIACVVLLALAFFVLFGTIGVHLFGGRFAYCTDPCIDTVGECRGVVEQSVEGEVFLAPRVWLTPPSNFNHLGNALVTLLEVASTSGWSTIMFRGTDVTSEGRQPVRDANRSHSIYFVLFVLLCGFLLVSVFIGIIMDHINAQRGVLFLSEQQKQWVDLKRSLLLVKPVVQIDETTGIRAYAAALVRNRWFGRFVISLVALNVVVLSLQGPDSHYLLDVVGYVIIWLFFLEAVVKLLAYTPPVYFKVTQNRVDFAIVVLSVFSFILENVPSTSHQKTIIALGRASRIGRIFLLAKAHSTISIFFQTFIISLPAIVNVSFLMIIMLFVYAYIAGFAFSNVRDGGSLSSLCNFRSFAKSLFVLFRNLTLDGWNSLMWDTMRHGRESCTVIEWEVPTTSPVYDDVRRFLVNGELLFNDCGSPAVSYTFFITFYILGTYIVLNVVVAVVLDCFSSVLHGIGVNSEQVLIPENDVKTFRDLWASVDTKQKGVIPRALLPVLCNRLANPYSGCTTLARGAARSRRRMLNKELEMMALEGTYIHRVLDVGTGSRTSHVNKRGVFKFSFSDVLQVLSLLSVDPGCFCNKEREVRHRVMASTDLLSKVEVAQKLARGFLVRQRVRRLRREFGLDAPLPPCPDCLVPRCSCWSTVRQRVSSLPDTQQQLLYQRLDGILQPPQLLVLRRTSTSALRELHTTLRPSCLPLLLPDMSPSESSAYVPPPPPQYHHPLLPPDDTSSSSRHSPPLTPADPHGFQTPNPSTPSSSVHSPPPSPNFLYVLQ